ncbi:MAG: peptidase M19 [Sphingobium sp.]|jgi:membrane dipeptidase|nr:MAG: peptidase M19 [Sphingobium sp.]
MKFSRLLLGASALAQMAIIQPSLAAGKGAAKPVTAEEARAAHDQAIVLDTHFDTPANLGRPGWSIMDRHVFEEDGDQVDYPRMVDGGVDGGFFAVYTPQGPRTAEGDRLARDAAIVRAVQIREMVARHSDVFELALTADDAERIAKAGKRFVFLSMENGYPFEGDLSLMRTFRALGVVMASPAHFANNDLADSATDPKGPEWHGLSPKGKDYVAEANRLGIVIDASHSSDESLRQMVALSKAPIILSHSGMRAIFDHPRNVSDADAKLIAAKGGVIQLNAFNGYMIAAPKIPERDAAMKALMARFQALGEPTPEQRKALLAERKAIDAKWPAPRANFDDFMKHMLHAIKLVGVDHVGVSGDFDGGGGIDGFEDVTDYPKLSAALLKAGYTPADVAKIWGGNALRVVRAAQAIADPAAIPKVPVTR